MTHSPVVAELRGITDFHQGSLSVVSSNYRLYHGNHSKLLTTGDISVGVLGRLITEVYTYLNNAQIKYSRNSSVGYFTL